MRPQQIDDFDHDERLIVNRCIVYLTILASPLAALGWAAEPVEKDRIEGVRSVMDKWVETRQTISKERQDWVLGREMLNERIQLVQGEIDILREKIAQAQKSISDADTQRAELVQENETLKSAGAVLTDIAKEVEVRTLALDKRLPDPIRGRIKSLSQRLPDDPNETKLSLSERFMSIVGILNEVNKFNRGIEVASEVRTLADGSMAEVTALYVGLGQAYYTGANGTVAGIGRPGPDGWLWEPANDAAEKVAEAVAILKNEKVAGFVPLPVTIHQGTANAKQ